MLIYYGNHFTIHVSQVIMPHTLNLQQKQFYCGGDICVFKNKCFNFYTMNESVTVSHACPTEYDKGPHLPGRLTQDTRLNMQASSKFICIVWVTLWNKLTG